MRSWTLLVEVGSKWYRFYLKPFEVDSDVDPPPSRRQYGFGVWLEHWNERP